MKRSDRLKEKRSKRRKLFCLCSTVGSWPRLWTTQHQTAETHSESKAANEPWTNHTTHGIVTATVSSTTLLLTFIGAIQTVCCRSLFFSHIRSVRVCVWDSESVQGVKREQRLCLKHSEIKADHKPHYKPAEPFLTNTDKLPTRAARRNSFNSNGSLVWVSASYSLVRE